MVDGLLAVHALTGCDTTSQPFGMGKLKAAKVVMSAKRVHKLGEFTASMHEFEEEVTSFIADCLATKEVGTMSDIWFEIWHRKISNKNITSAPALGTLPPTTESFLEHIKRSHLQCMIWLSSTMKEPPAADP